MKQGGNGAALGFTIVETLIVLAVTGAIFISIVGIFNGRQKKTEFQQASNEITTQIQQTIREVSVGYYPNMGNLHCTGLGILTISSGGVSQGTNQGCVFLGKVIQFGVDPPASGNNQQFITYTLTGCQLKNCLLPVGNPPEAVSLSEAEALVIAPGSGAHTTVPNASVTANLENGLSVAWMKYADSSGISHNTYAVGFLQSLGSYATCTLLCSGSQQVSLYGINNAYNAASPHNLTGPVMVNKLDTPGNYVQASQVRVCFQSATTNQSGLVTIGGNGRQLSVILDVKDGLIC